MRATNLIRLWISTKIQTFSMTWPQTLSPCTALSASKTATPSAPISPSRLVIPVMTGCPQTGTNAGNVFIISKSVRLLIRVAGNAGNVCLPDVFADDMKPCVPKTEGGECPAYTIDKSTDGQDHDESTQTGCPQLPAESFAGKVCRPTCVPKVTVDLQPVVGELFSLQLIGQELSTAHRVRIISSDQVCGVNPDPEDTLPLHTRTYTGLSRRRETIWPTHPAKPRSSAPPV